MSTRAKRQDVEELKKRLKNFALAVIALAEKFPTRRASALIVNQNETLFWLEIAQDAKLVDKGDVADIVGEGNELLSIVVSSIQTARRNA